jgi:ABC-type lipoprotein release transport system permease subunit
MFLVPEVRATDPANFLAVAFGLLLVAALATVAPTLRALRVDPAVALRDQ